MQLAAIQEYMEYLFCVALKKCGNLNDAEDLTQEVLLAALQYPKEIVHIKPWLCMVLNQSYGKGIALWNFTLCKNNFVSKKELVKKLLQNF